MPLAVWTDDKVTFPTGKPPDLPNTATQRDLAMRIATMLDIWTSYDGSFVLR